MKFASVLIQFLFTQIICRTQVNDLLVTSQNWIAKASSFVEFKDFLVAGEDSKIGVSLFRLDNLKVFVRAGDNVIFERARFLVSELRIICKLAKSWKSRYDRFIAESGTKEDLKLLLEDAKYLAVDFTEFTDILTAQTKCYCLCRQLYFGDMVGCDSCDEWYHFSCIGITVNSSVMSKLNDTYVCVRCALKNSFNYSAELVANLTNKWSRSF